jgi:hypothetical protein
MAIGERERALDILPRCKPIASAPVRATAPNWPSRRPVAGPARESHAA